MKYLVVYLCLISSLWADDPPKPPAPMPEVLAIVVPQGVTGDGKRESPYSFDNSTICVLMFPKPSLDKFSWDLEDSTPNTLVMPGNGAVAFNLQKPGEYLIQCSWVDGKSKAWFVIKGSGPAPPTPVNNLEKRLRTALVGVDAKSDAVKFSAICKGFADFLDSQTGTLNYVQMKASWDAARMGAAWPAGKYPDMPNLIRDVIPTATESVVVTSELKASITSNLRLLQATADKIAGGK